VSQAAHPSTDFVAIATSVLDPRHPVLRGLARRRPLRVCADVARCYAIIGAAFALLYKFDGWWAAVLSFLMIGTQQYALAVIEHDGKHGNLFSNRAANDRFTTWLLCAPIGLDPNFSRKVRDHSDHHRLLGTDPDPERRLYTAGDKATLRAWLLYLTELSMLPRAAATTLRYALRAGKGAGSRKHVDAWWPTIAVQALLVVAIAAWWPWWYYVAFWIAPIYPLVFAARKIRAFCEHAHPVIPDAAADRARLITYVPNLVERVFFAPMMMGYHGEHHLWPYVPYYNLPELHRLIGRNEIIEVRRSYVSFLWTYLGKLPLLERADVTRGEEHAGSSMAH
jgi:fatty acid desaturase